MGLIDPLRITRLPARVILRIFKSLAKDPKQVPHLRRLSIPQNSVFRRGIEAHESDP